MKERIDDIRTKLLAFFQREVPSFDPGRAIPGQTNSLQLFALVARLEKEFGVRIHSMEITGKEFHDLDSVSRLLARKLP